MAGEAAPTGCVLVCLRSLQPRHGTSKSRTAWRLSRPFSSVGRLATPGSGAADEEKRRERPCLPPVSRPDFRHLNSVAILCGGRLLRPSTGRLRGLEASCVLLLPPQPHLQQRVNHCTRGDARRNTWITPSTTAGLIVGRAKISIEKDSRWGFDGALRTPSRHGFDGSSMDLR